MPKFRCKNEGCGNFGKDITFPKVRYKFDEVTKGMTPMGDFKCGVCGKQMEEVPVEQDGDINIYFAGFRAKSKEQKTEILKKRAKTHTNKKLKEKTSEIKKRFGV